MVNLLEVYFQIADAYSLNPIAMGVPGTMKCNIPEHTASDPSLLVSMVQRHVGSEVKVVARRKGLILRRDKDNPSLRPVS